ncbi:MAG: PspC domain-containing protein [Ornithinimicrobium sp.]
MDENPANNGPDRTTPPAGEAAPGTSAGATSAATPGSTPGGAPGEAPGAAQTQTFEPPQPPPTGNAYQGQPPPRSNFFDVLRGVDVRRTPDRWIGGVAAGLAHRVGVDPLVIRAGFIVLGLFFGLGIALYLLAWALIPDSTETTHLERGLREGRFASIAILILAAIVLLGTVPWWDGGSLGSALFGLIVIAGIGYGLYRVWGNRPTPGAVGDYGYRAGYGEPPTTSDSDTNVGGGSPNDTNTGHAPPPPPGMATDSRGAATPTGQAPPPPPPGDQTAYFSTPPQPPVPPAPRRGRRLSGGGALAALVLGALLVIVGGLVWSADAINLDGNPITVAWCAGLILLGVVLLALGFAGRRAGFVGFFAAIAAFAVIVTAPLPAGLRWNNEAGQVTWTPTSTTQEARYEWGAGNPTLDLTNLTPQDVTVETMDVDLGAGELVILVPEGLDVLVNTDIGVGSVSLRGENTAITDESGGSTGPRFDSGPVELDVDFGPPDSDWERNQGGLGLESTSLVGSAPADLEINAEVGVGQVTIIETEGQ